MQFPPLMVGIVGALVSFLSTGLDALDARRVGALHGAVLSGVSWGGLAAAATAFVAGVAVLWWARRPHREPALRVRAAIGTLGGAVTGPLCALAGGWLGARMAGTEALPILGALADATPSLWPAVLVPMLLGAATLLPPSR